ncbi:squalene synthase HpnC [Kutzneria albida]|uniref:Squalene synthase HpnC n=1 Tax=Kutzneria albida DSM 43870 TaxID=1449976 RepID=W5W8Y4_9PSEU|nr:squalene synthase HpnC [Kutzneria albida]AHH97412.1 hypothetical protein KALB_4048 [Kutzneria albida DSM 43870]
MTEAALRASARKENFPVAMAVLARRHRRHLTALYRFARTVDEIGDTSSGDRSRALAAVAADLDRLYRGEPPQTAACQHLTDTIVECALPKTPFEDLVAANLQDQRVHRYRTFAELLDYCRLSANPVGHLVLRVFGSYTTQRARWSDSICTALQVLEHCQDVREDLERDRVYLPAEDLARFGVTECELRAPSATRATRALLGFQVQRAVRMLEDGRSLVDQLRGAARIAVAGYVAGGLATAAALARRHFDVLNAEIAPSVVGTVGNCVHLLTGGTRR